jgi:hypothetical protein
MQIKDYRTGISAILLLTMMSVIAQAGAPTLESNIDLFLNEAGLRNTVKLESITKDRNSIYATPNKLDENGTPMLLSKMKACPDDWQETKGLLTGGDRLCHRGRWKSFHSTNRPSLHVVVFRERAKEGQYRYFFHLHFDRYVPSVFGFRETFKHLALEVIPHILFGKKTSQRMIKQALDIQRSE